MILLLDLKTAMNRPYRRARLPPRRKKRVGRYDPENNIEWNKVNAFTAALDSRPVPKVIPDAADAVVAEAVLNHTHNNNSASLISAPLLSDGSCLIITKQVQQQQNPHVGHNNGDVHLELHYQVFDSDWNPISPDQVVQHSGEEGEEEVLNSLTSSPLRLFSWTRPNTFIIPIHRSRCFYFNYSSNNKTIEVKYMPLDLGSERGHLEVFAGDGGHRAVLGLSLTGLNISGELRVFRPEFPFKPWITDSWTPDLSVLSRAPVDDDADADDDRDDSFISVGDDESLATLLYALDGSKIDWEGQDVFVRIGEEERRFCLPFDVACGAEVVCDDALELPKRRRQLVARAAKPGFPMDDPEMQAETLEAVSAQPDVILYETLVDKTPLPGPFDPRDRCKSYCRDDSCQVAMDGFSTQPLLDLEEKENLLQQPWMSLHSGDYGLGDELVYPQELAEVKTALDLSELLVMKRLLKGEAVHALELSSGNVIGISVFISKEERRNTFYYDSSSDRRHVNFRLFNSDMTPLGEPVVYNWGGTDYGDIESHEESPIRFFSWAQEDVFIMPVGRGNAVSITESEGTLQVVERADLGLESHYEETLTIWALEDGSRAACGVFKVEAAREAPFVELYYEYFPVGGGRGVGRRFEPNVPHGRYDTWEDMVERDYGGGDEDEDDDYYDYGFHGDDREPPLSRSDVDQADEVTEEQLSEVRIQGLGSCIKLSLLNWKDSVRLPSPIIGSAEIDPRKPLPSRVGLMEPPAAPPAPVQQRVARPFRDLLADAGKHGPRGGHVLKKRRRRS